MPSAKRKSSPRRKPQRPKAAGSLDHRPTLQEEALTLEDAAAGVQLTDLDRTRLADRIEPDEVDGWARLLDVSPARLNEVIAQVGPNVEDVRRALMRLH